MRGLGRLLLGVACVTLLYAYAAKMYSRNWDWLSEDDLFISAQKVWLRSNQLYNWGM